MTPGSGARRGLARAQGPDGHSFTAGPSTSGARSESRRPHSVRDPPVAYFSGYDGDQRFGIPTFNTFRGDTFQVGGNGISPYTFIRFQAVDTATGAAVDFFGTGDSERGYTTAYNAGNCVVNEEGPLTVNMPNGRYRVSAFYLAGNLNQYVTDQVVDVVVSDPQPAPAPKPPRSPCLSICPL